MFRGSFRAAKFLTRMLSGILRRIFGCGPKKVFVEILRPFVSVNNDFLRRIQAEKIYNKCSFSPDKFKFFENLINFP